jgi:hypothetical protein
MFVFATTAFCCSARNGHVLVFTADSSLHTAEDRLAAVLASKRLSAFTVKVAKFAP